MTIDRNAFYQIKVESIGNKIIDAFVTFSDKTFTLKVPNYSTPRRDKLYILFSTIRKISDLTNIPFSLAFVNEKVLIGNETKQLAAEQKSYLIDGII